MGHSQDIEEVNVGVTYTTVGMSWAFYSIMTNTKYNS